MDIAFYLLQNTVLFLLYALDLAMLLRAIFSWILQGEENRFSAFLYMITEPLIQPVRKLCYKKNWFQQTPMDIPFLITVLLIMVVEMIVRSL